MTTGTTREIKCPNCGAPPKTACRSIKSDKPLTDDHAARRLMSVNEAAARGIVRLRKPMWANRMDHMKIDLIDGKLGLWTHLFAPYNVICNGRDPCSFLIGSSDFVSVAGLDSREFEIYDGPLPTSDEYAAEVARLRAF